MNQTYMIIWPYEMNEYHKKGYEFVAVVNDTHQHFNNIPGGQIVTIEYQSKLLVKLNSTGQVLYGSKDENQPANT